MFPALWREALRSEHMNTRSNELCVVHGFSVGHRGILATLRLQTLLLLGHLGLSQLILELLDRVLGAEELT